MLFENIIGNEKTKIILKNIQNYSHAYMFIGQAGIGKKEIAKEFAKKILCLNKDTPCNTCNSCLLFDSNSNSDLNIIEPDESSVKIEQIRELIKKVPEKPTISFRKVYIINDADKMTVPAQNCLLKVLEEPPSYITFILIGKSETDFLSTIRSRCLKIYFDKLNDKELEMILKNKFGFEYINPEYFKLYNGSVEKAINLKGKEDKYIQISTMIRDLESITKLDVLNYSKEIYQDKLDIINILEYMQVLLYEKAKENLKYLNSIEKINEAIKNVNMNGNAEMLIDNLLLSIYEEVN